MFSLLLGASGESLDLSGIHLQHSDGGPRNAILGASHKRIQASTGLLAAETYKFCCKLLHFHMSYVHAICHTGRTDAAPA